jgi:hypothetical protein
VENSGIQVSKAELQVVVQVTNAVNRTKMLSSPGRVTSRKKGQMRIWETNEQGSGGDDGNQRGILRLAD